MIPARSDSAKHSRSDRRRGLTIIELVIAIFVGLVVILAAGSVYVVVEKSFRVGARKLVAQQEATLLATGIGRRVRLGDEFLVYQLPDRFTPEDSGDGLAILDQNGDLLTRIEWDEVQGTLVDSTGTRVTALTLADVQFSRSPAEPQTVRYRFAADDLHGNRIEIESAATSRN